MKKQLISTAAILLLIGISIFSCKKKDSGGIAPEFGNSGNPTTGPTVTGNTTYTNPATDNTSIGVGGSGWNNPTCGTTNSLTLKATSGSIDVTIGFLKIPTATTGTYVIARAPGENACTLSILNAPNQPAGVTWYGNSGTVTVNASATSISASFNGIICTQLSFNFPTVTASGFVSCSQ